MGEVLLVSSSLTMQRHHECPGETFLPGLYKEALTLSLGFGNSPQFVRLQDSILGSLRLPSRIVLVAKLEMSSRLLTACFCMRAFLPCSATLSLTLTLRRCSEWKLACETSTTLGYKGLITACVDSTFHAEFSRGGKWPGHKPDAESRTADSVLLQHGVRGSPGGRG